MFWAQSAKQEYNDDVDDDDVDDDDDDDDDELAITTKAHIVPM